MKYIISESQYNFLLEQSTKPISVSLKDDDAYWNVTLSEQDTWAKREWEKSSQTLQNIENLDPHTLLQISEIGAAFIPVVGPMIAAGIGMTDAALYYKQGDKKSAALSAVFSLLPGMATVVGKIPGIKKLGQKGMLKLASKISKGEKVFTPEEAQVAKQMEGEVELIKNETKKVWNLTRKTTKSPRLARDFGKVKLSDNLERSEEHTS